MTWISSRPCPMRGHYWTRKGGRNWKRFDNTGEASCRISLSCARYLPSYKERSCGGMRDGRDSFFRTVDCLARHHRSGDARHFVRERHGRQSDTTMLQNIPQPGAGRAVPPIRPVDHRHAPQHQHLSYLPIARLGDPTKARLPASRVLPRHQPHPSGELPRRLEGTDISHRRRDKRRGDQTDAGDRRQTAGGLIATGMGDDFRLEGLDPLLNSLQ